MTPVEKKHIITIAGRPGSGKSTAARAVAEKRGYQRFSSGDLFRSIAKERGIDVLQANVSAEGNYDIDHLVDGRLQDIGKNRDDLVIDSRMAWHWMPYSFKVFLDLDLEVAAARILKDLDPTRVSSEHVHDDPKQYAELLRARLASETKRYKALYNVDPYEMENYDLVIHTDVSGPAEVAEQILTGFQDWLNKG